MNFLTKTALLTLVAGCLQPAFGQIVPGTTTATLEFKSVDPGSPYYTINPGGTVFTGTYKFSATSLDVFNTTASVDISLFCIDVGQHAVPSPQPYTVKLPSVVLDATKATNLARLYGHVFQTNGVTNPSLYDSILTSWTGANAYMKQAFQLAVWELSQDTNFYLGSGSFSVTLPSNDLGAYAQAQAWLNTVSSATPSALEMTLIAFQSDTYQDQLYPVLPGALIPEPSAVAALLGLGMLGVAGARRRFRGATA